MSKDNEKNNVWLYFKRGDIIKCSEDSIWGNTKFEITSFHGNWYCPLVMANICGKFYSNGMPQRCNIDIREARLIDSDKRPFAKMKKKPLLKLLSKGNIEAKREFKIRVNNKTL